MKDDKKLDMTEFEQRLSRGLNELVSEMGTSAELTGKPTQPEATREVRWMRAAFASLGIVMAVLAGALLVFDNGPEGPSVALQDESGEFTGPAYVAGSSGVLRVNADDGAAELLASNEAQELDASVFRVGDDVVYVASNAAYVIRSSDPSTPVLIGPAQAVLPIDDHRIWLKSGNPGSGNESVAVFDLAAFAGGQPVEVPTGFVVNRFATAQGLILLAPQDPNSIYVWEPGSAPRVVASNMKVLDAAGPWVAAFQAVDECFGLGPSCPLTLIDLRDQTTKTIPMPNGFIVPIGRAAFNPDQTKIAVVLGTEDPNGERSSADPRLLGNLALVDVGSGATSVVEEAALNVEPIGPIAWTADGETVVFTVTEARGQLDSSPFPKGPATLGVFSVDTGLLVTLVVDLAEGFSSMAVI